MKESICIKNKVKELGINLDDYQCNQFIRYYEILVEWNQVMNLTAITEFNDVLTKHFVDSLELIKVFDLSSDLKVIDLGTGAGFPGIPLKIVFPHLEITLVDSLNKRIKFLNSVIMELQLQNIEAIHARAEDLGRNKRHRECYDLCVSRAVANLATLSEYCIPFVKKRGYFISYKSGKIEEELEQSRNAIKVLGGKISQVESFSLLDTEMGRSFVIIEKCRETAGMYPRLAGKPSKEPLK